MTQDPVSWHIGGYGNKKKKVVESRCKVSFPLTTEFI